MLSPLTLYLCFYFFNISSLLNYLPYPTLLLATSPLLSDLLTSFHPFSLMIQYQCSRPDTFGSIVLLWKWFHDCFKSPVSWISHGNCNQNKILASKSHLTVLAIALHSWLWQKALPECSHTAVVTFVVTCDTSAGYSSPFHLTLSNTDFAQVSICSWHAALPKVVLINWVEKSEVRLGQGIPKPLHTCEKAGMEFHPIS